MRTSEHHVLVTGGSAGIGLAMARAFVERGNRVAICGRDAERLAVAKREIAPLETFVCDLTNDAELPALVDEVGNRLGGLSVLVNNAGVQLNYDFTQAAPFELLTEIDREIATNLGSAIKLTALCLPLLRQAQQAAIVNVSSGLAIAPKTSAPVYCATKAALHSFSKALRYQLEDGAPSVSVVEVLPPLVDTAMGRGRPGAKVSAERVARDTLAGLERDVSEIRVGRVKALVWMSRLAPPLADRIMRRN